jgi:hypothetical protein
MGAPTYGPLLPEGPPMLHMGHMGHMGHTKF